MIDVRGQNVSDEALGALYDDIMRRTNNGVEILFKMDQEDSMAVGFKVKFQMKRKSQKICQMECVFSLKYLELIFGNSRQTIRFCKMKECIWLEQMTVRQQIKQDLKEQISMDMKVG